MKNYIGNWEVDIIEDTDGHLNIYIENIRKSDIIQIDTGQGDGINGEQLALRFTTKELEEIYRKTL